jgi:DNA-directed RNA polymerase sigma subunit (sigma70/sigma32)
MRTKRSSDREPGKSQARELGQSQARVTMTEGHEMAMSQREVAAVLGVSYERIGQIERRALRKLRAECERRGWDMNALLAGPGTGFRGGPCPGTK